jgi:chemosensory pili system protein ChpA (sensor histidine kinase/response regulator)
MIESAAPGTHVAGSPAVGGGLPDGDDLSALTWVYAELRRSLETAHKSLRRFLKEAEAIGSSDVDAADPALLRAARSHLHQGVGALELIGLPAAAQMLRASEMAVQRLAGKPALVTPAAVDTLERASFALLDFLARQLAGKPVSPLGLFPRYRDAQQLAGADRVHPADLWRTPWQWRELPPDRSAHPRQADDAARAEMETLVLGLMRQPDGTALARMSDFCADLAAGASAARAPGSARLATFWQLAAAMFEAQAGGLLAGDVYVKRIASRLLAQLRTGARGQPVLSDRLAHDLLFFCSHAAAPNEIHPAPRLAAVRSTWRLERESTGDYETVSLGRFDPAWVALARKRVAGARDAWSAVAGGETHRLSTLAEQFALVGDSTQKLFPHGERLAQALQAAAAQTVAAGSEPPPKLAMEVATSILYLDACLEDGEFEHPALAERIERLAERIDAVRAGDEPHALEPWMEELYRRVSDRQTMGSVVQELRASLSEVEKRIDQYFRQPSERGLLLSVPAQLNSMRGVLSVLGLSQASQAVLHMRNDVDALTETEVDPQRAVQAGTFDRLADNLGALSFLIDMLSVQPALAKSLFRFDPETGSLSAVVGQAERISAFGGFDELEAEPPQQASAAAPLAVQLQSLALALDSPQVDDEVVMRRLDRLSQQAVAADEPELARTLGGARVALRNAGDAETRRGLRGELAQGLHTLLAPAPPPPPAAATAPAPLAPPLPVSAFAPAAVPAATAPGKTGLEDDVEMREIFLEEAREVVGDANDALQRLADGSENAPDLTVLRRAFHTLKGSGRMVGLTEFGEAAWACEQLYNARLALQPARMDAPLRQFTREALDYLAQWTEAIAAGSDRGHRASDVAAAADALRLAGERVAIASPGQAAPPVPAAQPPAMTAPVVPPALPPIAADAGLDSGLAGDREGEWEGEWDGEWDGEWGGNREAGPEAGREAERDAHARGEAGGEPRGPALAQTLAGRVPDLPSAADLDLAPLVPLAPLVSMASPPAEAPLTAQTPLAADAPVPPAPDFSDLAPFVVDAEAAAANEAIDAGATHVTPPAAAPDEPLFELDLSSFGDALPVALPPRPPRPEPQLLTDELGAGELSALQSAWLETLNELPAAAPLSPPPPPNSGFAPLLLDAGSEPLPELTAFPGLPGLPEVPEPAAPAAPHDAAPVAGVEALELDFSAIEDLFAPQPAGDDVAVHALEAAPAPAPLQAPEPEPEPVIAAPATSAAADAADADEADDGEPVRVIGRLRIGIPLFNIFLNEADELSRRLGTELAEWAIEHAHTAVSDTSIALAHSLAGSSATVGYSELSALGRALEHALMRSQSAGHGRPGEPELFNAAADEIRRLLHQFAAGFLQPVTDGLMERLAEHERWPTPPLAEAGADLELASDAVPGAGSGPENEAEPEPAPQPGSGPEPMPFVSVSAPMFAPVTLPAFVATDTEVAPEALPEAPSDALSDAPSDAPPEPLPEPLPGALHEPPQDPPHDLFSPTWPAPAAESSTGPVAAPVAGQVSEPLAEPLAEPAAEAPSAIGFQPDVEAIFVAAPEPDATVEKPTATAARLLETTPAAPQFESTPAAPRVEPAPATPLFEAAPEPLFAARFAPLPEAAPAARAWAPQARADAFDDEQDIDAEDVIDAELFPIFEEEAEELLPQLQERLRDWVDHPAGLDAPSACMRTLHTFKGGARLAGAMRLGEMAHRLETAIEHRVARGAQHSADIEPLLARADNMQAAFALLCNREAPPAAAPWVEPARQPAPVPAVASAVVSAVASGPAPAEAPGAALPGAAAAGDGLAPSADSAAGLASSASAAVFAPVPAVPAATPATSASPAAIDWARFALSDTAPAAAERQAGSGAGAAVRVRAGLLDRLVNQAGEMSITRARIDADVRVLQASLGDLTDSLDRMRRQLHDIELQAETQISSRMEAAKAASQAFDPLEMDRFTRFQELTRFMAESVNDVATLQRSLQRTLQSTEDELAAQARLTRGLQDDLLRTRMVEFESLADRLYRTVRQAAKETGKQVRLDIVGGAIEVDRGVLERMIGPFEHLLRNSVAHGIEAAERRLQAGKEADGHITVSVSQSGNEVAVEFGDDGGGLDLGRIRQRGIERQLITPGQSLSDTELSQLIFAPGFSTAESVTELAGRGVGMDVVRTEVNAMGGRIETASTPGQGTRFRLLLPLTTAVTQVVMLRCGVQSLAVPSTLVEVVRRVPVALVDNAYASGHFDFGDEAVPFFWLAALLQGAPRGDTSGRSQTVVIIRSASQRVALHVDEVVGNQEVVVKNVGAQLARLPGLVGVTLLPSGVVSLIYNPVALASVYADTARRALRQTETASQPADAPGAAPPPVAADPAQPRRAPMVLVVDDSLTVRRVTQRLLAREGYRVVLAKDGLEALERLAEERPTVLLSDIEMPRMDGFDLLRNVRADERLSGLPVVMITSRIAQKHHDYAIELGVDHYLGKPYSEELLLSLVARYARAEADIGVTAG